MPKSNRKMVDCTRIHARLIAEREKLQAAVDRGDATTPEFNHDQGIPLWHVIERLLDRRDRQRTRQVRYRQNQRIKRKAAQ